MAVYDTMVTTEGQGNIACGRVHIFHALFFWRVHIFQALSFLLTSSDISCFVVSFDMFKCFLLCRFFF